MQKLIISIHASLREATTTPWSIVSPLANFNSRLSARGYNNGLLICVSSLISIHASLREATAKTDNI